MRCLEAKDVNEGKRCKKCTALNVIEFDELLLECRLSEIGNCEQMYIYMWYSYHTVVQGIN